MGSAMSYDEAKQSKDDLEECGCKDVEIHYWNSRRSSVSYLSPTGNRVEFKSLVDVLNFLVGYWRAMALSTQSTTLK